MAIRIFAFDLEGTILTHAPLRDLGETPEQHSMGLWARLVHALGSEAIVADANMARAWDAGRFKCYTDWCDASLTSMKALGLNRSLFDRIMKSYSLNPGVIELSKHLRRENVVMAIISGGFLEQAKLAQAELGFRHVYAAADLNWDVDGNIRNWSLSPSDYRGKVGYLRLLMEEYGIRANECAFVGDGANDVHVASFVGKSFAYNASPKLAAVATHSISHFNEIINYI